MKKTVSLVLSGGGARGFAHIGVIKALEEKDYEIKSISGTSMGALIGGLKACGKLDEYTEWITAQSLLDIAKLIDFNFSSGLSKGLIKGEALFGNIKRLFGDELIENLNIKFTAVATNLTKQKEIWYQKGSLIEAIRASIAIPGIFVPVYKNNEIIVDGGIINNMPIAPTMSDDTDIIVAVDVNGYQKSKYAVNFDNSKFEHLWRKAFDFRDDPKSMSINLMMDFITKHRKVEYPIDININISREICGIFDFHKHKEIIEIGKKIANDIL
jgi:NTE family protein